MKTHCRSSDKKLVKSLRSVFRDLGPEEALKVLKGNYVAPLEILGNHESHYYYDDKRKAFSEGTFKGGVYERPKFSKIKYRSNIGAYDKIVPLYKEYEYTEKAFEPYKDDSSALDMIFNDELYAPPITYDDKEMEVLQKKPGI